MTDLWRLLNGKVEVQRKTRILIQRDMQKYKRLWRLIPTNNFGLFTDKYIYFYQLSNRKHKYVSVFLTQKFNQRKANSKKKKKSKGKVLFFKSPSFKFFQEIIEAEVPHIRGRETISTPKENVNTLFFLKEVCIVCEKDENQFSIYGKWLMTFLLSRAEEVHGLFFNPCD